MGEKTVAHPEKHTHDTTRTRGNIQRHQGKSRQGSAANDGTGGLDISREIASEIQEDIVSMERFAV